MTRNDPLAAARVEVGMRAMRALSIALALVVFIVGFSVDDLQVLRFPGYLFGVVAATALVAIGPLLLGRRFARAHAEDDEDAFAGRAAQHARAGALVLLVMALAFVGWLIAFSTGVPPWVR